MTAMEERARPNPGLLIFLALTGVAVLMLIIGVVMGLQSPRDPAKVAQANSDLELIANAIEKFKKDTGRVPTEAEGLDLLAHKNVAVKGWHGPYIAGKYFDDPWYGQYEYKPLPPPLNFQVTCFGSNRRAGGNGGAEDIVLQR